MTVSCKRLRACGRSWPRDPILEVACPACNAAIGVRCRRPSGHACAYHAARDVLADSRGFYGECPLGLCGIDNVARRRRDEARADYAARDLFDEMAAMERRPGALAAALDAMGAEQ